MLEFLAFAGVLIVSLLFAFFWFAAILPPLLYWFPKALYWCARGAFLWRFPFLSLVVPVAWLAIPCLIGVLLHWWGGMELVLRVVKYPAFIYGQNVALVLLIGSLLFSSRRRADARFHFFRAALGSARIGREFDDFIERHIDIVGQYLDDFRKLAASGGSTVQVSRYVLRTAEAYEDRRSAGQA